VDTQVTFWTIPNLVLHDKPVRLASMRCHGRKQVFVDYGNPDCHRNAELDVNGLPDNVTFGDLQPRTLSAPSANIAEPTLACHGRCHCSSGLD
jgi:hypothetical protein